ncbi:DNA transformation protein [Bosea sp. 62]|uniref:TfoX/Sxy family protein n=1 Tax=unclassified Bosea (in: a-proteobacteria) TaxID=2653178 RepID=UPI0012523F13|nr:MULTISPECIES: TfoX/Sxy family protein [unclassified Bosea (in: a-proteobacteria)]CAD5258362.1 DNA transformation protein [Bosea sp. 46]CAD5262805.1 DNA transformation protein [Bosea sp. 21B]CAD5277610.1 DNA transformation protein [Bosea sp. 7B]VVT58822.1 DNA transformation protein [Bosea sp. EC-HK365B]VXB61121.1 DNA transformation protein [Bosea sp. 29B]
MDADAIAELFAPVVVVRMRRMFGGLGVYAGDAMFALAFDGEIFLKTTEATRPEFMAVGSEPFRYMARSRERELGYWRLPAAAFDDEDVLRHFTEIALADAREAALKKGIRRPLRRPSRRPGSRPR